MKNKKKLKNQEEPRTKKLKNHFNTKEKRILL